MSGPGKRMSLGACEVKSQGVQVGSLVRELRSVCLRAKKNQNIKEKQYCNKFNKYFKNSPH